MLHKYFLFLIIILQKMIEKNLLTTLENVPVNGLLSKIDNLSEKDLRTLCNSLIIQYENDLKLEGIRLESFMHKYYDTLMKQAQEVIEKNKEEFNLYMEKQLEKDVESKQGDVL